MKKTLILAAAAIAALSACTKEIEVTPINDTKAPVFSATIEPETKTTLANGTKVNWENTDEVSVNGTVYTVAPGSDATTATLTKKNSGDGSPASPYKAYYPASMYSAGTATLPASYAYTEGKFNMPMYAENTETTLAFKNLCGVLAITIPSTQMPSVTSITVSSDQQMNGAFTATTAGVLTFDDKTLEAADKKVTLTFSEAKTITSSETFCIPVPAGTHNPLTITVTNGSIVKVMKTKKTGGVSVERSKIYPITFGHNGDSNILCGLFSVAADKKVQFTKGNLWCNSTTSPVTYAFEEHQYDYPVTADYREGGEYTGTWLGTHIGHFNWATTPASSYAQYLNESTYSTSDLFWLLGDVAERRLTVSGTTDLYVLSEAEWNYLLENRTNASNLYRVNVTVAGKNCCLIFAPDAYSGTIKESYTAEEWATAEADGLVCLPAAGILSHSAANISFVTGNETCAFYWSSTASPSDNRYACYILLDSNRSRTGSGARNNSSTLRLVKTVE